MMRTTRRSRPGVGGAALPFLRITAPARAHARTALTFGLSSYPPTILPWANAGTAAATVKLMIYRGLLGYDQDGQAARRAGREVGAATATPPGCSICATRCSRMARRSRGGREMDDRAGRRREIDRLFARRVPGRRRSRDAGRQDRAHRHEAADRDLADLAGQLSTADHSRKGSTKDNGRRRRRRAVRAYQRRNAASRSTSRRSTNSTGLACRN